MKSPHMRFIHSQIRNHRSMAEFSSILFPTYRYYCSQRCTDKSIQITVDGFQLCSQKNSFITQVDSVHSARATYKKSAFRIPIESVLRIKDWF